MANVKIETKAVVNGNPVGSVLDIDEKEGKWLVDNGYASKVEQKKSAKTSTKKAEPKEEPKEDESKDDKKSEE